MQVRDVVVFIHGMMLEDRPPLGRVQYERLWEGMLSTHAVLNDHIDEADRIQVEWGKFVGYTREPDHWINFAQEFLARRVDPELVRAHPGPNNMVIPPLRESAISELAWKSIAGPLRQCLVMKGLGDMVYYCGADGQQAVQASVYRQILQPLERYRVYDDVTVRLHLIAHSMGAMIANDFLHGLFAHTSRRALEVKGSVAQPSFITSEVLKEQKRTTVDSFEYWRQQAGQRLVLGSIASLGSPLPLLLLRSQRMVDAFGTGNILSADEIGLAEGTPGIVWKNFYDADDLFAFPVRPLFGDHPNIQDVEVVSGRDPWSHEAYWGCRDVQEKVAALLFSRTQRVERVPN